LAILALVPTLAAAQVPNVNVRFALHAIDQPTGKAPPPVCSGTGAADPVTNGISCIDYVTARPANSANWVYLVIGDGDSGINGASFGVEYSGIFEDTYLNAGSWTLCSDGLAFPSDTPPWPASGSGMLLTWATCQTTTVGSYGIHAVVAEFYMYAYGGASFAVTPNTTKSSGPELDVNTCGMGTTKLLDYHAEPQWPYLTGRVDFGGGFGYNACGDPPATERSSWGRLKTQFTGGGK
jgi:hypothetical protein